MGEQADYVRDAVAEFDRALVALRLELPEEVWVDVNRLYRPVRAFVTANVGSTESAYGDPEAPRHNGRNVHSESTDNGTVTPSQAPPIGPEGGAL